MKKIICKLTDSTTIPEDASIVLTQDPLSAAPRKWFEDYFDYPNQFEKIYRRAKEKSMAWCCNNEFSIIKLAGVNFRPTFEHVIHSVWMQIERDTCLAERLIEKEAPDLVFLSQRGIDYEAIVKCRFDPGLFEFTLKQIARQKKVTVENWESDKNYLRKKWLNKRQHWVKKIRGACSAQIKSIRFLMRSGKILQNQILISGNIYTKTGKELLEKCREKGFELILSEPECNSVLPTIYSLYGYSVGVIERIMHFLAVCRAFNSIKENVWQREFTINGIDYGPVIKNVMAIAFNENAWIECYRMLLLKKYIERNTPQSFVVLFDHGINEAYSVQFARSAGIRTVALQHGICNRIPAYVPLCTDLIACWGESEKATLAKQGIEAGRMVITGFPPHDKKIQQFKEGKYADSTRKIKKGPLKILIATQGVESSVEWRFALIPTALLINHLIDLHLDSQEYSVVIRLHPNERLDGIITRKAIGVGLQLAKGESLEAQIEAADVIVTQFSTVGVEALLHYKPLVSLNWVSSDEPIPFAQSGVASRSLCPEDFIMAVEDAVANKKCRYENTNHFIHNYLADGYAAERLLDIATCQNMV